MNHLPDIDRMVAEEVMGWRLYSYETDEPAIDHLSSDGCAWRDSYGCDGFNGEAWAWHPSTNIAHAWEVVEKMRSRGYGVRMFNDLDANEDDVWCFSFVRLAKSIHSKDAGLPLAICRAALACVRGEA